MKKNIKLVIVYTLIGFLFGIIFSFYCFYLLGKAIQNIPDAPIPTETLQSENNKPPQVLPIPDGGNKPPEILPIPAPKFEEKHIYIMEKT